MRTSALLLIGLLATSDAFAQERIRDMSLPPDATLKEPDIVRTDTTFGGKNSGQAAYSGASSGNSYGQGFGQGYGQGGLGQFQNTYGNNDTLNSSARFMDNYCNSNATIGAGNGAMQSCMASNREQACRVFAQLPGDAQHVIDQSISCAYSVSETDQVDSPVASADPSCAADEHRRLVLLKKYWSDQNTAYAMVFLPDLVLSAGNCTGARGY